MEKDFDRIDHDLFITKLKNFGFKYPMLLV